VRRSVLLVLSVALAVLVFAPVAAAQSDDMGADDRGMDARGADDRGLDDRGMNDRGMDDRGFDDRRTDDNATASAVSSAPASATTSATGSASASASPTSSATSSSSPSRELPDTGGISPIPLLLAAALLIGSAAVGRHRPEAPALLSRLSGALTPKNAPPISFRTRGMGSGRHAKPYPERAIGAPSKIFQNSVKKPWPSRSVRL
jgi:LPXTG-motif cell wall-anchored protein